MLFRRLVREAALTSSSNVFTNESLSDVRMTTTDNYQGEESDIVSTISYRYFFIYSVLNS